MSLASVSFCGCSTPLSTSSCVNDPDGSGCALQGGLGFRFASFRLWVGGFGVWRLGFRVAGFGYEVAGCGVGCGLVLHDVLKLDEVLREDQTVVEIRVRA